ncbi:hypothetical protein QN344_07195, partial [Mucilaginibacter sp. 5B2]|nr:hypothetical protein [Mucilaginibacter sp. 5B2]
ALSSLSFHIILTDADIEQALHALNTTGKYENAFPVEIYNTSNEVCAQLMNEVYIRDLNFTLADT